MALNFADIANKKVDDVERPALPPVGTYRWRVTKLPEVSTSKDEKWDILTIPVRCMEALDNVDVDQYKGDITNVTQTVKFMFNKEDEAEFEKSEWRMRQFFEKHVKCVEADATVAQMLNASVNGEFLGDITWSQDKQDATGETFFANLNRTAPIE